MPQAAHCNAAVGGRTEHFVRVADVVLVGRIDLGMVHVNAVARVAVPVAALAARVGLHDPRLCHDLARFGIKVQGEDDSRIAVEVVVGNGRPRAPIDHTGPAT